MNLRVTLGAALLGLAPILTVSCLTGCDTGSGGPSPAQQAKVSSGAFIGSGLTTAVSVGSFTQAAALSQGARAGHTATLLDTGNVLVVAGQDGNGGLHTENEIYDVAADTWTPVSQLAANQNDGRLIDPTGAFVTGRTFHTAVKASTGVVVIAGGLGFERVVNNQPVTEALPGTYTFNPTNNTFTRRADMPTPRYWHLSELLGNGTVMVCAGWNLFGNGAKIALQSADIYDLGGNTWTAVTGGAQAMSAGHTYGNMHVFGQNVIVVNGGSFDNNQPPSQQQMPAGLTIFGISPAAVMIGSPGSNGKFSAGGEIYTLNTAAFGNGPSSTRAVTPSGVMLSGSVALTNGDIFFAGGENLQGLQRLAAGSTLSSTELLSLNGNSFTAGPDIGDSRPAPAQGQPALAPLQTSHAECARIAASGDVLVIGGANPGQQGPVETPFCEIYDSINNLMKGNLNMAEGRIDHRVVSITGTNKILVIGGRDAAQNAPKDTCEIYDR